MSLLETLACTQAMQDMGESEKVVRGRSECVSCSKEARSFASKVGLEGWFASHLLDMM